MSPTLDSKGQGESPPVAKPSHPHPLEYSVTGEHPEEVSETSRIDGDDGSGDRHTCGELHASDEARLVTNPGVAVEHLEEQMLIKPKVSLSCKKWTYKTKEDGKKETVQSPVQELPKGFYQQPQGDRD